MCWLFSFFGPQPVFTYNSRASLQAIQFGSGVSDLFNPTVTQIDSTTVKLIDGVGAGNTYDGKDTGGKYLAPATARVTLTSGWKETPA